MSNSENGYPVVKARLYLITVQSMNFCEEHGAAGVASAEFVTSRETLNAEAMRGLMDTLDSTINGASVDFRPMTFEEIQGWRNEMAERKEAVDKLAGDSVSYTPIGPAA